MQISHIDGMKNGWYAGNFQPTAFKTMEIEVAHHIYKKGHTSPKHYHKITTEINYILKGKIKIDNHLVLEAGHIFVVKPLESISTECLEDTEIIVARDGSFNDKVID